MLKMLQGCLKSLEYIVHVSELRLENIIPPKEKLKRTNNDCEDSKNMVRTDGEVQLLLETYINIKTEKTYEDID